MKGDNNPGAHDRNLKMVPNLVGNSLPNLELSSTYGETINLAELRGRNIFVLHPVALPLDIFIDNKLDIMSSIRSGVAILTAFNQLRDELAVSDAGIFGVNTQSVSLQKIVSDALGLRYPLLSDLNAELGRVLKIPLLTEGRKRRFPLLVIESRMGLITRQISFPAASDCITEELRHLLLS